MYGKFQQHLRDELKAIEEAGLYKKERNIASAQSAEITLQDGSKALNFCANNYLGLADSPRLVAAAEKAMKERGYGISTRNSRKPSPITSIPTTPSSMRPASTPTAVSSSRS